MNNSRLIIDNIGLVENENQSVEPKLRAEEARLIRIIEAIGGVKNLSGWRTLQEEIFDPLVNTLSRDLQDEAKKDDPDPKRLNRLAGELLWAERYANLEKLESSYKYRLQAIRKHLNGNE